MVFRIAMLSCDMVCLQKCICVNLVSIYVLPVGINTLSVGAEKWASSEQKTLAFVLCVKSLAMEFAYRKKLSRNFVLDGYK